MEKNKLAKKTYIAKTDSGTGLMSDSEVSKNEKMKTLRQALNEDKTMVCQEKKQPKRVAV